MKSEMFSSKLNAGLFAGLIALTLAGFFIVPLDQSLSMHWNVYGEVDRSIWAPYALLLAPGIAISVLTLLGLLGRTQNPEQIEAGQHIMATGMTAATGIALVMQVMTILIGLGQAVEVVRIVTLCIAVLLLLVGNVMPKSRPNGVAGIRVPPALSDARNWQATQRLGGRLFVGAGLLLVALAMFVSSPAILLSGVLAGAVLPVIIAISYSYRLR